MEKMQFTFLKRLQIFKPFGVVILSIMSVAMSGVLPPKFVRASLKLSFIVSDAYIEAASNGIEIWFGHTEVEYGNHIWIEDLKKEPTLINWVHNNEDRFTLIMSGLDAPSSDDPSDREVLYWLVGNIPETDIEAGEQWAAYVPPWPLGGVGPHRVIVTIYKQNNGTKIIYPERRLGCRITGDERENFSTRRFGEKYKLQAPWAANFFDLFDNSSYPFYANVNN